MVVCPVCHGSLVEENSSLTCHRCARCYHVNSDGFYEFIIDPDAYQKAATTHSYAEDQSLTGTRLWANFFIPLLSQRPFKRVLDVGCGVGKLVTMARQDGYDAYGVDLPALSSFWPQAGNH